MKIYFIEIKLLNFENKICNEIFYFVKRKQWTLKYQLLNIKKKDYVINDLLNLKKFIINKINTGNSKLITFEKLINHFILFKPENSNYIILRKFYLKLYKYLMNNKYEEIINEIVYILENFLFENLFINNILSSFKKLINVIVDLDIKFKNFLTKNYLVKIKNDFKNFFEFKDFLKNDNMYGKYLLIQCFLNYNLKKNISIMNYFIYYQLMKNQLKLFSNWFILFNFNVHFYKEYNILFLMNFYKNYKIINMNKLSSFSLIWDYKKIIFVKIEEDDKLKNFSKTILNINNYITFKYMKYLLPNFSEIHTNYKCSNSIFCELYHLNNKDFDNDCFKIEDNYFILFNLLINLWEYDKVGNINKIIFIIKKIVYLIYFNNKNLKDLAILFYIVHKFLKNIKNISKSSSFNNINEIFSNLTSICSIIAIKNNDFYKSNIYFLKYIFPKLNEKITIYQICFLINPKNVFDIYVHNNIIKSLKKKNYKYYDIIKMIKELISFEDEEDANSSYKEYIDDVIAQIKEDCEERIEEEILKNFDLRLKENYYFDSIIKLIKHLEQDIKTGDLENMNRFNSIQYYNLKDFLLKIKKDLNTEYILKNRKSCFLSPKNYLDFLKKYKFIRIFDSKEIKFVSRLVFNKKFKKHFKIELFDGVIVKNQQKICILEIFINNVNEIELFFKKNLEIFKIYNPKVLDLLGVFINGKKNDVLTLNFVFDYFDSFLFEDKKYDNLLKNNFITNLFSNHEKSINKKSRLKFSFDLFEFFISNYLNKINIGLILPYFIVIKNNQIKIIPPILFFNFINFSNFYKFVVNKHIGTNLIKTLFNDKIKHKIININLPFIHPKVLDKDIFDEKDDVLTFNDNIKLNNLFKIPLLESYNNNFDYEFYSILNIIIRLLLPNQFKKLRDFPLKTYLNDINKYKEEFKKILEKLNEYLENNFDIPNIFEEFENINFTKLYLNFKSFTKKNVGEESFINKEIYNIVMINNYIQNQNKFYYLSNSLLLTNIDDNYFLEFNEKKIDVNKIILKNYEYNNYNFGGDYNFLYDLNNLYKETNVIDENDIDLSVLNKRNSISFTRKFDENLNLFHLNNFNVLIDKILKYIPEDKLNNFSTTSLNMINNIKEQDENNYIFDIFGNIIYYKNLDKRLIFKNIDSLSNFIYFEALFPFKFESKIIFDLKKEKILLYNYDNFILYNIESLFDNWTYKNFILYTEKLFDLIYNKIFYFKINCQKLLLKKNGFFEGTLIGNSFYEGVYTDSEKEIIYNNTNNYFNQEVLFENFYIVKNMNYIKLTNKLENWIYEGWCTKINPDIFGTFKINNFVYIGEIKNLRLYNKGEIITDKKHIKFLFNSKNKFNIFIFDKKDNNNNILIGKSKIFYGNNFNLKNSILKLEENEFYIEGIKYNTNSKASFIKFGLFKFKENKIFDNYITISYLKNFIFTGINYDNNYSIGELKNNKIKSWGILWKNNEITTFKGITMHNNIKKLIYYIIDKNLSNINIKLYNKFYFIFIKKVLNNEINVKDNYQLINNNFRENYEEKIYFNIRTIYKKISLNEKDNIYFFTKNLFKGICKIFHLNMVIINDDDNSNYLKGYCLIFNKNYIFKGHFDEENLKLFGKVYNKFNHLIFEGKINLKKNIQLGKFYINKSEFQIGKFKDFKLNSYGIIKNKKNKLYGLFKLGKWYNTSFRINNLKNKIISLDVKNKNYFKVKSFKLLGNKIIEKDNGLIYKIYIN